jgi:hypothetical protein
MSKGAMIMYLTWLRREADRIQCKQVIRHAIMGVYLVQVMASVRLQAQLLGFHIPFIPSGVTDQYQPLDRSIFSCIKSTARVEYLKLRRDEGFCEKTPSEFCEPPGTDCQKPRSKKRGVSMKMRSCHCLLIGDSSTSISLHF